MIILENINFLGWLIVVKLTLGAASLKKSINDQEIIIDMLMDSEVESNQIIPRLERDTSQHLDENFKPINPKNLPRRGKQELPEGVPLPADGIIPAGFDFSTLEEQDDGQFCVYKTIPLEGIEKMPVQTCVHRVDKQCYDSYVTQYTPTTEDVCSDNYKKKCYIEYAKTSVKEEVEKCYHPMERVCSPPTDGEVPNEVCQTQYETSCVTRYKDTPIVEDVEECNKVYKKSCEYVKVGYNTEKVCSNKPVEECAKRPKTVYKKLPDTQCERIPFEACAPDNCQFIPGEPQCHNKTVDIGIDVPEEVCDLQPQKMCKQVYRLVPKLNPQEVCEEVPREVCYTTLKNPRKVKTDLKTKWCFTPDEEPEKVYNSPEIKSYPTPHAYPPPPPHYPLHPNSYPPHPPKYIPHPPKYSPHPPKYSPHPPKYSPVPAYPPPHLPPSYPPPSPIPVYHPASPVPAYPPPHNVGQILKPKPKSYGFKLVGDESSPIPSDPVLPSYQLLPPDLV